MILVTPKQARSILQIYDHALIYSSSSMKRIVIPETNQEFCVSKTNVANYSGSKPHLTLMSQFKSDLRKYIEKNGIPKEVKKCQIIRKNDQLCELYPVHDHAHEVDINSAYWETAKLLGIISEKTYKYGLPYKVSRNSMVGMLATKQDVFLWDGEKETYQETLRGINLWGDRVDCTSLFWKVANHVNSAMSENINESFFYWVDACFSPYPDFPERMRHVVKNYGFEVKSYSCSTWYDQKNQIYTVKNHQKETIKTYMFSRSLDIFPDVAY